MLALQRPYSAFENGLHSGNALAGFEGLYVAFRVAFGKVFLLSMVFVFFWPLVLLFGFWLKLQRRYFLKYMKKEDVNFRDVEDYLSFKKRLEKLDQLKPNLDKVNSYQLDKAPPVVKFTLKQMQKTCSTLLTFRGWSQAKLVNFNKANYSPSTNVVKFKSESELWKSRNSAYRYWM